MNGPENNRCGRHKPEEIPAGVVGLGLMGTSVVTCLLAAGHSVVGVEVDQRKRRGARQRVLALLEEMKSSGLPSTAPRLAMKRLTVSGDYRTLSNTELVIEAVSEDMRLKKRVRRQIEERVSDTAIIGHNTSSLSITLLQRGALHPDRILGIHWMEPAHTTRFMEILCGRETAVANAERIGALARLWGKDPTVLRKEIQGYISNRCMYALMREACYLVDSGYATIEEVDRSVRNDLGYWITFAGPFRFMDITGIPAYRACMKNLFPLLNSAKGVPALMNRAVRSGARGVSNTKGFYTYSAREARRWARGFTKFTYDIRAVDDKYSWRNHRK